MFPQRPGDGQALLADQVTAKHDFPAMRTQRKPAAIALAYHLCPPAVEFEPLHAPDLTHFDPQHVAIDGRTLVIACMALDTAQGEKQHPQLNTRERQDRPRAKPGKSQRDDQGCPGDKTKGEHPVGR